MELSKPESTSPLSVILKLPGDTCNINCFYCFEKRKPYEGMNRIQPEAIRRLVQLADGRPLAIELHGGEPLLVGREHLATVFSELRRHRGGMRVSMQTNGTLLTKTWMDFLDAECPELELGISLDGDTGANTFRRDYADRPTAARVAKTLRMLAERGRDVGLIAVVTSASLGREAEIVNSLAQYTTVRNINFAPCFDHRVQPRKIPKGNAARMLPLLESSEMPGWAITPDQYAEFLKAAVDAWIEGGHFRRFALEPVTSTLRTIAGRRPQSCHFSEQKCAHTLTLYPDGSLGSCDELGFPEAKLAHIDEIADFDALLRLETNPALLARLNQVLGDCEGCSYAATCGGGCLATRLRYQGTPLYEEYCHYRATLVDHIQEISLAAL